MRSSTSLRSDEHGVGRRTQEWVAAGLISTDQADAIRRFERSTISPSVPADDTERLGLGAEVAAYLGSMLALMGGIVVVGQRWREMALLGRLGIAVAVAVVGLTAGAWLVHLGESATKRLGSLLWVVGVAGVALAIGVLLDGLDADAGTAALVIGVVVAVLGVELWRNEDRPLQLLTTAVGVGVASGGVVDVSNVPVWRAAFVVWPVAAVWFWAAATGRLRPRLVGLAAGFAGAMIGAAMLGDLDAHAGPAAATLTAAAVVVFALADHSQPVLVIGVIGFLVAVQTLLASTFTSVISSGLVTLIGLAIVVAVVLRARTPPAPPPA